MSKRLFSVHVEYQRGKGYRVHIEKKATKGRTQHYIVDRWYQTDTEAIKHFAHAYCGYWSERQEDGMPHVAASMMRTRNYDRENRK